MLIRLEEVLLTERPDWVLVYGDTNSTLAGALAAVKLHIPVAHIEAGLRSFNRSMPEEHNRVLTDHCADLLFCPTQTAVDNLVREGITQGVHLVGDVMYDAVLQFGALARQRSTILDELALAPKSYLLATLHRPYNTDDPDRLRTILETFAQIEQPVVFPVHPRTRKRIVELGLAHLPSFASYRERFESGNLLFIAPIGYLDMLMLEQNAHMILTDSGGIQKEAYFFGVPCITLRPETEWVETVDAGWNLVVDLDRGQFLTIVREHEWPREAPPPVFGNGRSAARIVKMLSQEESPGAT
jgi:UDP-N-acetylglucosamine 2-epimerase